MADCRIAVLVGSLRKESLNRRLSRALTGLAPEGFGFHELRIDDLPLYNQDEDEHPAASVDRFRKDVSRADALLIVTPEYNRSIPGVLKNALDQGSRPMGHNAWAGKPAGVIGIALGSCGTALAQQHLRNILAVLNVPTMAQPEAFIGYYDGLFTDEGGIGERSREFLQSWMDKYIAWVKLFCS
ncbi:NADPH-dependent FMN reductase [Prosthecochloris vibrioformis]|uniref:NAD(P)H-dependent oxidoreductase n=1 Tax=Prosthecochloris vibrioformis TaxID=1098 RepID=A0A5C4RSL9_PROVB|nr:NAD(P)H-dependent oxidoreductase [Prosthecochloris vibrioformis]TNJ34150.1 NAD(P)H-dependent oxidoreductase [Prosthecochloris vibrioformis]